MAEAKAEVMEEIEDGRDEAEEEDSVDATSVRPGGTGVGAACGRDGIPAGLDWCGRGLGAAGRVPFCLSPAQRSQAPTPPVM